MKKLLLAAVAITGFIGPGSMATTELDTNDRPAMMQLARQRWNAMFEQLKGADANGALDVEMKRCSHIEALQRELMVRWRLQRSSP